MLGHKTGSRLVPPRAGTKQKRPSKGGLREGVSGRGVGRGPGPFVSRLRLTFVTRSRPGRRGRVLRLDTGYGLVARPEDQTRGFTVFVSSNLGPGQ